MIWAVVDVQLINLAIDIKMSLADAVCIASGHLTGTRAIIEVIGDIFVAQHHVSEIAVAVGHFDFQNASAQRREFDARTTGVDEFISSDFTTFGLVGVDADALHINRSPCERRR